MWDSCFCCWNVPVISSRFFYLWEHYLWVSWVTLLQLEEMGEFLAKQHILFETEWARLNNSECALKITGRLQLTGRTLLNTCVVIQKMWQFRVNDVGIQGQFRGGDMLCILMVLSSFGIFDKFVWYPLCMLDSPNTAGSQQFLLLSLYLLAS